MYQHNEITKNVYNVLKIQYNNNELPDSYYSVSQIFKIILNISLKNIKHQQKVLLFMLTSIELIID